MPELPEVETVRRGLFPVLEGAVIARSVPVVFCNSPNATSMANRAFERASAMALP